MNKNLILSVRLMTYNHAEFILDCLNGIENQQTDFNFEVVIGDDFSQDNNVELIKQFILSSKNKKINYILLDRKVGDEYYIERQKKGRLYNFTNILENCTGKYIALIDGDDYWTDPLKLQKQVDILEKNEEYNICYHNASISRNGKISAINTYRTEKKQLLEFKDLLQGDYIQTCCAVYRKKSMVIDDVPLSRFKDTTLSLCSLENGGKAYFINENMAVYRQHEGGVWISLSIEERLINAIIHLNYYLKRYADRKEASIIVTKLKLLCIQLSIQFFIQKRYKKAFFWFKKSRKQKGSNTFILYLKLFRADFLNKRLVKKLNKN